MLSHGSNVCVLHAPLAGLAKLYDDMDGDVEQIFGALGENAGKALK